MDFKSERRKFHVNHILSVGSFVCNLRCPFCQNHEISMAEDCGIQTVEVSPEGLADKAAELQGQGNIGVAYTYNEPLVGYEYVRDCAALAHGRAGLGQDIPLHLSRFFPRYKMRGRPPTPVGSVYALAETAREYLAYVYTGKLLK